MVTRKNLWRMVAAFALISVAALTARAQTSVVYGIADGGDLYSIDTVAHTTTQIFDQTNPAFSEPNGLAYNEASNLLYYRNPSSGGLYQYNITTNTQTQLLTSLLGDAASATYYNNSYWFVNNGTDSLVRVSSLTSTPVVTTYTNFDGTSANSFGFGDIVITDGGQLFGSTTNGAFFTANVAGLGVGPGGAATGSVTGFSNISGGTGAGQTGYTEGLQLALASGGLQAQSHNTGQWYTVNTATGARTSTFTTALKFRDLAGVTRIPEPGTFALLGAGLAMGGLLVSRRRK